LENKHPPTPKITLKVPLEKGGGGGEERKEKTSTHVGTCSSVTWSHKAAALIDTKFNNPRLISIGRQKKTTNQVAANTSFRKLGVLLLPS